MLWSYGVTTVPDRLGGSLPRTLESLARGGFDRPHLFVDGAECGCEWRSRFGLDVTARWPRVRTAGNWVLALVELYCRRPDADRYAVFQDDLVCSRNLRPYLERTPYPECGYLNLYTFPQNTPRGLRERHQYYHGMPPPPADSYVGFYQSNQKGKGALALVFNHATARTLASQPHLLGRFWTRYRDRLANPAKYPKADHEHRAIDGGVVEALRAAGVREYVHNPSLVYHTGNESTIGNSHLGRSVFPPTPTFRGEAFDLLSLTPEHA
jgi:hypothetical protein